MIPSHIYKVAAILEKHGFEAYLVGGSIRNILMGVPAKDFDITTNALPEQIEKLFPKSIMTNAKFGTVIVMIEAGIGELESVEVTTFRLEKEYVGGRWPSHVEFTPKLEDDLKRRDFTVNALALRLVHENEIIIHSAQELLISGKIVDLFNGLEDLQNKIIRAVGDPIERFTEDGLRCLRACRLASVYGFEIEEQTFEAISKTLDIANQISKERVNDEFMKLILKSPKPSTGIELMRKSGLLDLYIPELSKTKGVQQEQHGDQDVYDHLLATVDVAPPEVRLAGLFHDIGKATTHKDGHFYGHDREGAKMTKEIMTRLKFSNSEIEDTVNLVRWHMFFLPQSAINHENTDEENKESRNESFKKGWSDNAIRRMIIRVGGHEQIDNLIKLRIADAASNPKSDFNPNDIEILSNRIADIRQKESLMSIADLEINGKDLIKLGFKEGPEMKKVLNDILEKVVDDIELNKKDKLIEIAKTYLK